MSNKGSKLGISARECKGVCGGSRGGILNFKVKLSFSELGFPRSFKCLKGKLKKNL
jgi:hypothetical protein